MSFKHISFGTPEKFNVVLEIPTGSQKKYEYDEELDIIKLDWIFTGSFRFPCNYGYIPETRGGDGDHLDAFVISSQALDIGTIIPSRAIGIIELLDRGEQDDKIIAVPITDKAFENVQSLDDLKDNWRKIFEDFFKELGVQKNKKLEIKGFHNKERAIEELKRAHHEGITG